MMRFYFLIFFFTTTSVIGQSKIPKDISDTSVVFGIIMEDSWVGETISKNCYTNLDKFFSKGTYVIINNAHICNSDVYTKPERYFEVLFNSKTYFIQFDKLVTLDNIFPSIRAFSEQQLIKFKEVAKNAADKRYGNKIAILNRFVNNAKQKGILIKDWSFYDESEYTKGTSVKFEVYNPSVKTIKYIWFSLVGLNPVGDKVYDAKRGSTITVKGVGPINSKDTGEYEFSYVWFTDMVESVKITSVKVQYMDGSIKTITNPKEITLSDELLDLFESQY